MSPHIMEVRRPAYQSPLKAYIQPWGSKPDCLKLIPLNGNIFGKVYLKY